LPITRLSFIEIFKDGSKSSSAWQPKMKRLVIFQISCYYFSMKQNKKTFSTKEKLFTTEAIVVKLQERSEILFAYLHGSFLNNDCFNDIDLALYLKKMPDSLLEYELNMEVIMSYAVVGVPVDVRLMNSAPLSFQYNVMKEGIPIVVNDENERAEFQERTVKRYFDFAPFRKMYLEEVFRFAV
jgi:predicted nucleotidyltransferase